MTAHFRPAIVFILLMTLITGIGYPLAMTAISQALFSEKANGSLIKLKGQIVGSSLIGQTFTAENYFHGRPSATTATDPNDATKTVPNPYNAANSGGSNAGPTSQSFIDGIKAAAETLRTENIAPIPVDLVTASGSGLDPHITPAAALFQVPRVAKARHLSNAALSDMVAQYTQGRYLGIFGEPVVNVLKLNLALDALNKS